MSETLNNPQADPRITFPLAVTIFFSVLNGVMFNVAIPEIAATFALTPSEVSWVMTAYMATFALGALVYGKLADSQPVRRLIMIGLILLNLGSVLGFFAGNYIVLVMARVLQASGGAAIPALAMLVATRYFPQEKKGMVLGVIASTVSLGAAMGPMLGGVITDLIGWRYLFLMTLLTLFALPFLKAMLPKEKASPKPFDIAGCLMLISGMGGLLVAVTNGWYILALVAILVLAAFIYRINKVEHPFIHPSLFRIRSYRNTIIIAVFTTGSIFGVMFSVPIMLSHLQGISSGSIGLAMFPGAISAAIMGRVGGGMVDSFGGRKMILIGGLVLIAGHLALSTAAGASTAVIAMVLILVYVGFSFLQSALPHTVSSDIPREHTGVGMGTYSMFFFISGSFFTSIIGRFLDMKTAGFSLNPLNPFEGGGLYANIYFSLAVIVAVMTAYYWLGHRKSP
jgi:DHA2 family metal-tetracycline-proton antiporter-like MFS transporter